jgi:hypothetical protein
VGAQSTETIDTLKATPLTLLPGHIKAAMFLKGALAANIKPAEGDLTRPLPIDPASSASVFIVVGKKPLD